MVIRELFRHELMIVTLEHRDRIARFRRTSVPMTYAGFEDLDSMTALHFLPYKRATMALLFDSRDAPMVMDADLERRVGAATKRLAKGFVCIGVLLKTSVGQMQTRRINQTDQIGMQIFLSEAEAIQTLLHALPDLSVR